MDMYYKAQTSYNRTERINVVSQSIQVRIPVKGNYQILPTFNRGSIKGAQLTRSGLPI